MVDLDQRTGGIQAKNRVRIDNRPKGKESADHQVEKPLSPGSFDAF
jgi:hypothetical protein